MAYGCQRGPYHIGLTRQTTVTGKRDAGTIPPGVCHLCRSPWRRTASANNWPGRRRAKPSADDIYNVPSIGKQRAA